MECIYITAGKTENGFCGSCNLIPGWVVAHTGDLKGFKREVLDSIDFYVKSAKENGDEYPSIFDGEFEVVYNFDVRSLLLFFQGIFSFSALQTVTGINQRQLQHYASGISKPRKKQEDKIKDGLRKLALTIMEVTD